MARYDSYSVFPPGNLVQVEYALDVVRKGNAPIPLSWPSERSPPPSFRIPGYSLSLSHPRRSLCGRFGDLTFVCDLLDVGIYGFGVILFLGLVQIGVKDCKFGESHCIGLCRAKSRCACAYKPGTY
ncbi:uncharacterized protein [Primulina huaijiensis]|uniref:uncharacterized protein n=1 Tax=Primulina huaijiensis TaxID=1492673 RepID=UPI003CC70A55